MYYYRECPKCDSSIQYKNKVSYNRAIKSNNSCKKCCQLYKIVSEETKKKMSLNHADVSGSNNPMFGKSALAGKKWSDFRDTESINKSLELLKQGLFKNNKHTRKSKDRISQKVSGSNNPMFGKKHTKDTINKIRNNTLKMIQDGKINIISSIEYTIKDLLDKYQINYVHQYVYGFWSFDFYLTDYNLFIEVDGDYWHANPIFYTNRKLNETQRKNLANVARKNKYIKNRNKKLIRLWEYDIINNIDNIDNIIVNIISLKSSIN